MAAIQQQSQYAVHSYYKGEVIFKEGSAGDKAYIIKTGSVSIYKNIEEKRVLLARLKPGNIFGEMAVITGEKRSATAIADEICQLIAIDQAALDKELGAGSQIMQVITKSALGRLHDASKRISTNQVKNTFISVCSIIDFAYAAFVQPVPLDLEQDCPWDTSYQQQGIPYRALCARIKEVVCISQLDIDKIVRNLKSINLVELNDVKNSRNDVFGSRIASDVNHFLKLTSPKTFMEIAKRYYEEHHDALNFGIQEQELIDIHEFAALVNTSTDLIYKKIASGDIPKNLFFLKKTEAMQWANEMGVAYFQKIKRRSLDLNALSDVNDITMVDNSTLQEVFSKLGPYKMGILAWIANEEAREKIFSNLSTKIAAAIKEQVGSWQSVDEDEAGDIEKELIDIIKSLKGGAK